jgi:adenosine deaminase
MLSKPLGDWTVTDAESGSISESLAMRILARRLPKAELHVHFLGAIRASFPFASDRPRSVAADYVNAKGFFSGLREVAAGLLSADMFEAATLRVLEDAMNAGCRHVEMMTTPGELRHSPVPLRDALKAMGRAFEQKKRYGGLTGGLILETDRSDGCSLPLSSWQRRRAFTLPATFARRRMFSMACSCRSIAPIMPMI